MGVEIERKFLLKNDAWRIGAQGVRYRQGYLSIEPEATVRVRIIGDRAWLTIKGKTNGISRLEYEFEIPGVEAEEILKRLCRRPIIEKTRYRVPFSDHVWEIDEFEGELKGLVLAEIEVEAEDESFEMPPWIGREVSGDPRYFNSQIVANGLGGDWTKKETDD